MFLLASSVLISCRILKSDNCAQKHQLAFCNAKETDMFIQFNPVSISQERPQQLLRVTSHPSTRPRPKKKKNNRKRIIEKLFRFPLFCLNIHVFSSNPSPRQEWIMNFPIPPDFSFILQWKFFSFFFFPFRFRLPFLPQVLPPQRPFQTKRWWWCLVTTMMMSDNDDDDDAW